MVRHTTPVLEGSRRVLCLVDMQPKARHSPDNTEQKEIHVNSLLVRVQPQEDRSSASKKLTGIKSLCEASDVRRNDITRGRPVVRA